MILVALVPTALAVLANAVAASAMPQRHVLPELLYAGAALLLALAVWQRWVHRPDVTGTATWLWLGGAVLALAGPLTYGRAIGEFHRSHHMVRLAVVGVFGGLFLAL